MKVTRIRHAWPESKGFYMDRPDGYGEYTILHFHNPMYILSDEGMVFAKPNAFIIYDSHTPQKFYSNDYDVIHDWMHIKGDLKAVTDKYGLKENHIYYPSNSHIISDIVREMEFEYFSGRKYSDDILNIKINELIARASQGICDDNMGIKVEREMRHKLNRIRQESFMSLENEITVAHMAKKANMSESRFYVVYKSLFGVSPAKDLILARIQRAKFLLLQNEYQVSEVAAMSGYSNEYHFIRQFKQITGVTPGKYAG